MSLDIGFYLQRFWHRFPWFLIVVCAISAIGLTLALVLPPVYEAESVILVENPQISAELAASTVETGSSEALQIIHQRMFTRANMLDLAEKLKVYEGQPPLTEEKIVLDMRERTTIELPVTGSAADVVLVSFSAQTGVLSAAVTNELVTRILQENVALRTSTATQTLDFFRQEVERLGAELGLLGGEIMRYKLDHKDALPDSLEFRRTRQASQQERLVQLQREISSLKERRTRLVEIYQATGNVDTSMEPRSPEEARLRELKDELTSARSKFSPEHPKVQELERLVEALEATLQTVAPNNQNPDVSSTGNTTFDLQIADIDSQITFDLVQQQEIEKDLVALQASIDATPGNAIELDSVQRDYDNVQLQYNTAVERLGQAQTGDRIEALSKGQRMTVIEPAIVPDKPTSPKRKVIAVGAGFGGIALGMGLVVLLEVLNRTIHRPADLANKLGIQAFATVPYITTRGETLRRRLILAAVVLSLVIAIPALLLVVHQYYLPLDLLIGRVMPAS